MGAETGPSRFGPWRREALAFFELFALTGIAVAQPTFDLLGKNASTLVSNGRTRPQILVLTVLVLVVPAAIAWLAEVAVGLVVPALRSYAHAAIAAVIVGTIACEALKKQTGWGSTALVIAGVILGLAGGFVVLRFGLARTFLHYLAFAPVAFAILFVFFSPASKVIFPGGAAAADVRISAPSRVVMFVMDELPEQSLLDGTGKIDASLFPNFAALAAGSSWYRNDTTVSPFTETAVPAILTGDLPKSATTVPVASEYPNNLFTLLGGRYTMNVHETQTRLCPASLCSTQTRTTHPGLRGFAVDTAKLWRDFASPTHGTTTVPADAFEVVGTAQLAGEPFIRSLHPASGPELDFLHVVLPHQGWHFLASGQDNVATFETGQTIGQDAIARWPTDWAAAVGRQRHIMQLQYADQLLGRIVARLRAAGGYDNSVVVVTADHGVAFDAGEPVRGVSAKNYSQILWTPLFIKAPGQTKPIVSDQPVRDVDVLPTVADLLHAKVPWKIDGHSILGAPRQEGSLPILNWSQSTLPAPSGKVYDTVDAAPGFASVLRAGPAAPPSDAALRLYRLGPYGARVGERAAPYVQSSTADATATITDPTKFDAVNPTAHYIPWTWISGSLTGVPPGHTVAITVNGVIAGFSDAYQYADGRNTFWSLLPPQLFRAGRNEIAIYEVAGDPGSPRLTPVRIGP